MSTLLMKESYSPLVWLSLVPIVLGCSLSAMKEVSFGLGGVTGAMTSNVAFVLRNIFSKREMDKLKRQLQMTAKVSTKKASQRETAARRAIAEARAELEAAQREAADARAKAVEAAASVSKRSSDVEAAQRRAKELGEKCREATAAIDPAQLKAGLSPDAPSAQPEKEVSYDGTIDVTSTRFAGREVVLAVSLTPLPDEDAGFVVTLRDAEHLDEEPLASEYVDPDLKLSLSESTAACAHYRRQGDKRAATRSTCPSPTVLSCRLETRAGRMLCEAPRVVRVDWAAKEAAVAGVPVTNLDDVPAVSVCVLQADEVVTYRDEKSPGIAAVVGREQRPVQPDLILTRKVVRKSVKIVLLAEELGDPAPLGGGVPIAVVGGQMEWEECAEELDDMFLGDAEVWRRGSELEANPRGGKQPYVSADGSHTIVDLRFNDPLNDGARWDDGFLLAGDVATPYQIAAEVEDIDGVLAHGIMTQADSVLWPDASDPSGVGEYVVDKKGARSSS